MTNTVRISTEPSDFNDYMNLTDNYQLEIIPPSTDKNYKKWGWKDAESDQWTLFRKESNELYALYINPDKVTSVIRKQMNDHIKTVRKYDNDPEDGKHLLDKVALNGSADDCAIFNVVRGTFFQSKPKKHNYNPALYTALLTMENNTQGKHMISARCKEIAKGFKLPPGMKFLQIFRYIGVERPTKASQYTSIGFADKGKLISTFEDVEPVEDKQLTAYYYGCLVSIYGKQGTPGPVIDAPVILAGV